jgi:basic membrane protein A
MQNNKRRILVLMLCILFVGSMMGNVIAAEKKRSVSIVTDVGGVNDRSFNQSAWEGLQKVQKELQIETGYLESEQQADYMLNLQRLTDQKKDLIFGVGFMMADAIEESALQNPDQKYAMIDHTYNEIPENVAAITFKEEEGSFLAGYIAGKMSKTNKVGFIGGMDIPIVNKFGYGYKAGAKYANPNIEIIEEYEVSFADIEKG